MSIRAKLEVCYSDDVSENPARENFKIDIESWLFAINQSKAKFDHETIHALLRQMSGSFAEAISNQVDFDLVQLAERIHEATGKVVNLKEIVFYTLANLPNPVPLSDDQFRTFEQVILKAKDKFPEVVAKFESRLRAARA